MSMLMPPSPQASDWDYTSTGMDNFINRSIDQVSWQSTLDAMLNMPGHESLQTMPSSVASNISSNQMNYNNSQVSGQLGNTLQVGQGVSINGDGTIVLNDGTNDFLLMGSDGTSSGTSQ